MDTRKKGYDAFKGKLVLSRNLWITGAVCGIVAAVVGTFYTYEAILIQRRNRLFSMTTYSILVNVLYYESIIKQHIKRSEPFLRRKVY